VVSGHYVMNPLPAKKRYIKTRTGLRSTRELPSYSDNLVETVLLILLEPIYEVGFYIRSHGFRPGRSAHSAIRYITRKGISAR
jgi:retron-type reverse transcriptase